MQVKFEKELAQGELLELHSNSVPKVGDLLQVGNSTMVITHVHWNIAGSKAEALVTYESTNLKDKLNVCAFSRP